MRISKPKVRKVEHLQSGVGKGRMELEYVMIWADIPGHSNRYWDGCHDGLENGWVTNENDR